MKRFPLRFRQNLVMLTTYHYQRAVQCIVGLSLLALLIHAQSAYADPRASIVLTLVRPSSSEVGSVSVTVKVSDAQNFRCVSLPQQNTDYPVTYVMQQTVSYIRYSSSNCTGRSHSGTSFLTLKESKTLDIVNW
jgi:hypothetical protein